MGQTLNLGEQIHADIYRALVCVERNELDTVQPERLLKVSALAGELLAELDALWPQSAEQTDQASEAHTLRNEAHLPTE